MDAIRLTAHSRSSGQKGQGRARCVWVGLVALLLGMTAPAIHAAEPLEPASDHEPDDARLPNGLTLSSLTARAQACNPRLGEALADVNVFRGRAHQALLYPNPTLSGGAMRMTLPCVISRPTAAS